MKFTGEYRIPAPRDAVWHALNDTEILKASIDQVEELEWTGPSDLRTTIRARIGPMKARFRGTVELAEVDAPHAYTLIGKGDGGVAGFAKAVARVHLRPVGEEETLFVYDCEADIGGRLGTIGGSLVRGLADKATDSFFEKFASRLVVAIAARRAAADQEENGTGAGGPAASEAPPSPPFRWQGAAADLAESLKALEEDQQRAGLATVGHWEEPGPREGVVPLNFGTLLIVAGWAAMAGVLLLLFAT